MAAKWLQVVTSGYRWFHVVSGCYRVPGPGWGHPISQLYYLQSCAGLPGTASNHRTSIQLETGCILDFGTNFPESSGVAKVSRRGTKTLWAPNIFCFPHSIDIILG